MMLGLITAFYYFKAVYAKLNKTFSRWCTTNLFTYWGSNTKLNL